MNSSIKDTFVKNNLGRVVKLYLLLTLSLLFAEDFSYSYKVSTSKPYVKEGVILTVDLNQTNHDIVLLFDFDLKKSNKYTFQRLDVKETDSYHSAKARYSYLVYPLEAGKLTINFKLTKKVTNDDSVAYSFSGDRDNVKTLSTKDTKVDLKPLKLNVLALPKGTQLVGDFKLKANFKQHKAKAYEPMALEISIEGEGYTPYLEEIIPKSSLYTLFKDSVKKSTHSTNGTKSSIVYSMALSASKSFSLKSINIKAFNPKTKKPYILNIAKQHFDIEPMNATSLVDKKNNPKAFTTDWSWLTTLLGYIVVFISGFVSSMAWRSRAKVLKNTTKPNPLKAKIDSCKSQKELLQLLISTDAKKFLPHIEKLEKSLYGDAKIDLGKLKREIKKNC